MGEVNEIFNIGLQKMGGLIINMPSFLFLVILTFCKFCYFIRFCVQTYIIIGEYNLYPFIIRTLGRLSDFDEGTMIFRFSQGDLHKKRVYHRENTRNGIMIT